MFLKYFCISLFFLSCSGFLISNNSSNLKWILKLIDATQKSNVHFINFDNQSAIQELLLGSDFKFTWQFLDINKIKISNGRKIDATILRISNQQEFEAFHKILKHEIFRFNGFFIILNEGNLNVDEIFTKLWKIWIYNVNVLVMDSRTISMFTYYPFYGTSCSNTKAFKINELDVESQKWKTENFFPKKFKNLHGCKIRTGSYQNAPKFMAEKNNSRKFYGAEVDLVELVAERLNFEAEINEKEADRGTVYKNKTSTGLLGYAYRNELDLVSLWLKK
jgi:hypothetical protein